MLRFFSTAKQQTLKKNRLVFSNKGPSLQDFLEKHSTTHADISTSPTVSPYLAKVPSVKEKYFVEVFGCQMNVNDTEILMSIMSNAGYQRATSLQDASIVFLVTCAIRDNAEQKVWNRLAELKRWKLDQRLATNGRIPIRVGVLGCMAERLKENLLDQQKLVDVVCGPDAYRSLPQLLLLSDSANGVANVMLSADETYADIMPIRLDENSKQAFISIMRGCNNMCSFCIVPHTRGIEKSRPIHSILQEIQELTENGIKEITFLGQNVNSYRDTSITIESDTHMAEGFNTIYKPKEGGLRFADLLDKASANFPETRFRFTSPHPKDFPEDVLSLIATRNNICKQIHMPAQSGSTTVLHRMRRGYSRDAYLKLVQSIREKIPDVALSTDVITGFCGETQEEHMDTLSLMDIVKYDVAYMFAYSLREKTHAHRNYKDDVRETVKKQRLQEIIKVFHRNVTRRISRVIGKPQLILIEGPSKRSPDTQWVGKTDHGYHCNISKLAVADGIGGSNIVKMQPGDYVFVIPYSNTMASIQAIPIAKTTIAEYHKHF